MAETIIVVSPAYRAGKRQHDRFDAHLRATGEALCMATRQPLLDGARALIERGYVASGTIAMVWAHAPKLVTLRARIGVAATHDCMGERFVRRGGAARELTRNNKRGQKPSR